MPTPHPPLPAHPPPGGFREETDEALAVRLRSSTDDESAHCVALLTARHWQPAHDYAAICLASSSQAAAMATSAAFHRVLDHLTLGEPGIALRPRLLLTVRDTVRQWACDDHICAILPELRKPAGGRGMRRAVALTPEHRRLAQRSFEGLPGLARCLLWHTEVEAEPLAVPAGLLGLDVDTARLTLDQARETFREGCVRAHRDLAPTDECRFNNRLLDVPIRRGGALLPDVRRHLAECRYCRDAADQLRDVESALDVLLAEAVLGWGARRYLDSRPGRTQRGACARVGSRQGGGRAGGRHRLLSRVPSRARLLSPVPAPARPQTGGPASSWALRTGAGLVSAGLLATVLGVSLWSHGGDGGAAPGATAGGRGTSPGTDSRAPSAGSPAPGTAGVPHPGGPARLREAGAGLCLAVRGEPKAGAAAELASCSAAWDQQWSLEDDGLLRSAADPGLCLDSRADAGVVVLGTCADAGTARGSDVRYDLTVRGELLPRRDEGFALTSTTRAAGADIVVKVRDGSDDQRWQIPPGPPSPGALLGEGPGRGAAASRPAGEPDAGA
ncbi:RICIN domain-containing protein [Streptomyces tropicalis]|uniref:RICIN domain-containing protein n=1 Tax=Streptomyces tropicalis TaxID=3034234 RepID=A0ABT6A2U5_9ACTN|nr:RICIN domain-containing protein [Streptomyces tropicalis]MDF3298964.1 RICIN domain-containing protein [Streptomyces tropicalis]